MTMIVPSGEAGSMSCSGAFAGLPGCCATTSPRTLRRNPGGGRRQPLLAQLEKAVASSVEPSFLDLYRTWQGQIAEHLVPERAGAKKK